MKHLGITILSIFPFLLFISCNIPLAKYEHMQIVVKGENFTLSWEDDSLRIANNANKAVKYKIYFRRHGENYWQYLDETPAHKDPRLTVTNDMLEYGIYDLGVSAVNESGKESAIHSSLDMTAEPFCGWYINWIGSE